MAIPTVNVQNTKAEILKAYNDLLEQKTLNNVPNEVKDNFRSQVLSSVEKIEKLIAEKREEYSKLLSQIEDLKAQIKMGNEIKFNLDQLEEVKLEIQKQKKQMAIAALQKDNINETVKNG